MQKNENFHALIYNRVSSVKQESEGSGLSSQQQRCIQYAESKGYIVEKERIFHDTFSGGGDFMRRPAMRELLEYIDNNPQKKYVVIFDDLKRFARDTKFHIELKSAFHFRKVRVECLNFNFEDTPEGNFVETILAAQNQLEREQNQRQVVQKQRSRLESGYWAFHGPKGYTMKKMPGCNGKTAIPNEESEGLKEALEGFSDLKFIYLVDVAQFLKDKGVFGKMRADKYIDTVKALLKNSFYAGYVEYQPWNVTKRKGVHIPLISEATYLKNLERLNKPVHLSRVRMDDREEFELRRLVNCIHCNKPFTGAFSKGRSDIYPYYLCQNPNCIMNRKSIARDKLDDDFRDEMNKLKPTEEVIQEFRGLFEECWKEAVLKYDSTNNVKSDQLMNLEEEVKKYTEMAGETTSVSVRARYEQKIESLDKEIALCKQKSLISIDLSIPYQTALDKVLLTAKNPYESWVQAELVDKKKLYYFFFEENITYDMKNRYRTVKPSVLYRYFDNLAKNTVDVEMPGIEPGCK